MIKTSLTALVAAAAVSGIALPVMAEPAPTTPTTVETTASFDEDFALVRLQNSGVDAVSVEEWGTVLRAYVTLSDGSEVMQFFDPDTLVQVNL